MGKGHTAQNSNLRFTKAEMCLLLSIFIRGCPPRVIRYIAEILGRSIESIERVKRRLLYDGSVEDYGHPRSYLQPPNSNPWTTLTGFAKEYIEVQYFNPHIKCSVSKISQKTGIPEAIIQAEVDKEIISRNRKIKRHKKLLS